MADYGRDLAALFGLPPTPVIASQELNVCYALARRITTEPGALDDVGETEHYDSLDVTALVGADFDESDRRDLEARARAVLLGDPRVATVDVTMTLADGVLTTAVKGTGSDGPFNFVVRADDAGLPQIFLGAA